MKNDIKFHRGNTMVINVCINIDNEPYMLQNDDFIKLTVKRYSERCSSIVIEKIVTADNYDENGNLLIEFTPEDTVDLQPAVYLYDCGLQLANGEFYTFIPKTAFTLLDIITEKEFN